MDIQSIYPACLGLAFSVVIVLVSYNFKKITDWLSSGEAKITLSSLLILVSPFIFQILFQESHQSVLESVENHTLSHSLFDVLKGAVPFLAPFLTFFLGRYGKSLADSREQLEILQSLRNELDENYSKISELIQFIESKINSSFLDDSQSINLYNSPMIQLLLITFSWDNDCYKSISMSQIRVAVNDLKVFRKLRLCYKIGKVLQRDIANQLSPESSFISDSSSLENPLGIKFVNRSWYLRSPTYKQLKALQSEVKIAIKGIDSIAKKYSS